MKQKDFFEDVYAVVQLIPEGRVSTYGAIGAFLGATRSARMVGWAMNAAHGRPEIPAHRVVNRKGLLSGKHHFDHPDLMQQLLEAEGVPVKEDQIQDFDRYFWDPSSELSDA